MTEPKTKKCEVCSEKKPIQDFSKAYKNRCKACVAAEARMHRASQEAAAERIRPRLKDGVHRVGSRVVVFKKARIRATCEIVEVSPQDELMTYSGYPYKAADGRLIPACALQFEPEIDWEKRTFEAALAALTGILSNRAITDCYEEGILTSAAHDAAIAARTLIAELQKGDVQ